ncbi:MAG TPA: hypothetical protein VJ599_07165 [Nitrososphaeraceae archaeon]|nr:hypothetical protein [Nitrososphaeraceae archaeon]
MDRTVPLYRWQQNGKKESGNRKENNWIKGFDEILSISRLYNVAWKLLVKTVEYYMQMKKNRDC